MCLNTVLVTPIILVIRHPASRQSLEKQLSEARAELERTNRVLFEQLPAAGSAERAALMTQPEVTRARQAETEAVREAAALRAGDAGTCGSD